MLSFLAHAGEDHPTVVEEASHLLIVEWFIMLPLLLGLLALLGWATYRFSKSLGLAISIVVGGLLVAGIGLYSLSPVVSVVALALGFGMILLQVLADLSRPSK
jgi:hypothetical protein